MMSFHFRYCGFVVLACCLVGCLMVNHSGAAELTLAENGKSQYVIVLPNTASPVVQSAAKELQKVFQEISGALLPIVDESKVVVSPNEKMFVLGPSVSSQQLLGKEIDEGTLEYDTLCIQQRGECIVLTGHPLRGTLYAVNSFLEDSLGCRWWTSKESFIPKKNEVKVNHIDQLFTPRLIYRESFYRDAFNGPFAVRMKCNGGSNRIAEELGSHHQFQYFVHSFYPLIPPQKYFLDHPDWFPEINGVRKVGLPGWSGPSIAEQAFLDKLDQSQIHSAGTQLCLTNEEMRQELVKNALSALEKNPAASFISISQNDWHGYCQCAKCEAIAQEEGSQSGVLLRFVNNVAEDIEKVHPKIFVETLAYQYTRKPPKLTRPRNNVVVRLCSIECSFVQTLGDGPQNKTFKDDMVGWSNIADNLFVWDYVTDFALYLLPFPNYRVWQPNINFYIDHKVIGLFEQGDYHTVSGDFVQLRNWVMSKLLWNPSLNQQKLMDEFVAGYYAPELVPLYRDYFNILSDAAEQSGVHLGIFRRTTSDWLDYDSMFKVTTLMNQAVEIGRQLEKSDPVRYSGLVQKIERERIPLDLVWLKDWRMYRLESRLTGKEFNGPVDPKQAAIEFVARLELNGIKQHTESLRSESFEAFTKDLLERYEEASLETPVVPEICRDLASQSWIDIQENELSLHKKEEWTFIVTDEAASNKKADKMPGSHYEWATSWRGNRYLNMLQPTLPPVEGTESTPSYRLYLFVRCDATNDNTGAMTVGVYDEESKKNVCHRSLSIKEIVGTDYKMIDLGTVPFTNSQYFWAAPAKGHEGLDAVYIDRLVIVRER